VTFDPLAATLGGVARLGGEAPRRGRGFDRGDLPVRLRSGRRSPAEPRPVL